VSVVRPHRPALDGAGRRGGPSLTLVRGLPLPGYRGLYAGLPAGRTLRRVWVQQRPHAVYVATPGPLGWSAVRAARCLGIPVSSGFHTDFPGYADHYHAAWLRHGMTRYLRRFHNRTRGTFVPTGDLRERLRASGYRNLSLLGRGVDSRLFTPGRRSEQLRHAWGVPPDGLAIVHVGRIAPEKNLGLAVDAYRAIRRVHGATRFVLVGDGPARAALQLAHPDLLFSGVHTGEALATHYASADLFLFPSETETFGNVMLEAMASGLAVVAYDYAAARMHVRPGQTGMLVPYRAADAFVETAVALAGAPELRLRLRQRARQHAASVTWPAIVRQFETLLLGRLLDTPTLDAVRSTVPTDPTLLEERRPC
jgi:glycosyltransferase involved in cell wall biosynthesis